jgi:uncharacterized membrane protein
MEKKDNLSKGLAITGTVLAWLPILVPILLSLILLLVERVFRFDYLMPAELFFVALAGGLLILWAAFRVHSHQKLIGLGLVVAVVALASSQGLAVVTGLASGAQAAVGWRFAVVVTLLAVYVLALLVVAVGGTLLCRDLWRPSAPLPKVA